MTENAVGHHSAAFTVTVYAHLVGGDDGGPLDLGLDTTSSSTCRRS